mmetsp:Transcript_110815/g.353096  ORF Transcript_110815/g.353096 Transcript_110815/m.353096 type:complete len:477 (+) Transcript_110815:164-1594(+)
MEVSPKRRINGFERPFHPLQVLAWVVFGTDVFIYVVFGLPLVGESGARLAVALFYALSVVFLVVATYRATACDPSDPNIVVPPSAAEDTDSMPFCGVCNVPVFVRSKHCRACSKCVDVFDHHCMWLNNCVGGQNYYAFFVAVSAVSVMIGIILSTCLYLLVDIFLNADDFDLRIQEIGFMKNLPREFFVALLVTMVGINGPLFLLDFQLVVLHIFLASQHLTTYEYIMTKRSQLEDAENEARETESGGQEATERALTKRVRTLPHWMDWIVFSRCGKKRRKQPAKNAVEQIGNPSDTDGSGTDREAETREVVLEAERGSSTAPPPGAAPEASPEAAPEAAPKAAADYYAAGIGSASSSSVPAPGVAAEVVPRPPPAVATNPPPPPGQSERNGPEAIAAPAVIPLASPHHPGAAAAGGTFPTQPAASESDRAAIAETSSSGGDAAHSSQVPVADRLGCGCDKSGARPTERLPAPAKL